MRLLRASLFLALAASSAGCPRDLRIPPGAGDACEVDADCNVADDGAVRECGRLAACVAGRCEAADAGSILVPCAP